MITTTVDFERTYVLALLLASVRSTTLWLCGKLRNLIVLCAFESETNKLGVQQVGSITSNDTPDVATLLVSSLV